MKLASLAACASLLLFFNPSAESAPILHYHLNEGSGTAAADVGSGTPANGTLVGQGATWGESAPVGEGTSLHLNRNAGSTYLSGGNIDKIEGLDTFTVTMWVKFSDIKSGDRLFSTWNGSDGGFFDLRANNNSSASNLNLTLQFSNGETTNSASASTAIDATDWVFIAVVYNGSTTRFYLGDASAPVATLGSIVTVTGINDVNANSGEFRLGGTAATTVNRSPVGNFYDFRLYGEVLSGTELNLVRSEAIPEPTSATLGAIASLLLLRAFWKPFSIRQTE